MHLLVPSLCPIDSVVVEVQKMFSSHGSLLAYAMYHLGDYSYQINTLGWNKEKGSRLTDSQS